MDYVGEHLTVVNRPDGAKSNATIISNNTNNQPERAIFNPAPNANLFPTSPFALRFLCGCIRWPNGFQASGIHLRWLYPAYLFVLLCNSMFEKKTPIKHSRDTFNIREHLSRAFHVIGKRPKAVINHPNYHHSALDSRGHFVEFFASDLSPLCVV